MRIWNEAGQISVQSPGQFLTQFNKTHEFQPPHRRQGGVDANRMHSGRFGYLKRRGSGYRSGKRIGTRLQSLDEAPALGGRTITVFPMLVWCPAPPLQAITSWH